MKRFRVTVNQAAIAANKPAIHVHDVIRDIRTDTPGPVLLPGAVMFQGEALQDGARVWIEADDVRLIVTNK